MTRKQDNTAASIVKEALTQDRDFFVAVLQPLIQEALEHQMDLSLGAGKSERTSERLGYPKLCDWVEGAIEETFSVLPPAFAASQTHEINEYA